MKKNFKICVVLLVVCMMASMFRITAFAAGGSISLKSVSGTTGSTVTVNGTVTCSEGAIGAVEAAFSYDASAMQYLSGSSGVNGYESGAVLYAAEGDGSVKTLNFWIKFKLKEKVGTFNVSIGEVEMVSWEDGGNPLIVGKSPAKVAVKAPSSNTNNSNNNSNSNNNNQQQDNRDKNNKLSSLQVYPGALTPAFSADTTSYTVTVPADTKEVTISATAQSSKARVSVSGGKDLKLGPNEAQVIVVAENGSSIAYNLTIMCGEVEKIQINGTDNTIYEGFTDEEIPTGFTRTKLMYNEREYEGLINQSETMRLMGLRSEAGTAFYIYNQENQEFHPFVQIQIAEGKYIVPLPLNAEVETFKDSEKVSLTLQGQTIETWKLDEEFSVAYVMNQDGEECLYRYDSVDGTFQRYVDIEAEEPEPVNTDRTWFPTKYYGYALIGLVALVAILWITMVYFIASRKHRHEARKVKAMKKAEKQKRKEEKKQEKQRKKEEKAIRGY